MRARAWPIEEYTCNKVCICDIDYVRYVAYCRKDVLR